MASFTIRIGAILTAAGIAGYVMTGGVSLTALIPAAVGLVLIVLGLVGQRQPDLRKHAMHVAVVVAAIGLAGSVSGLVALPAALASGGGVRPAMVMRAAMALLLLVYIAIAVKSFVDARRARG
jgi:hypothetical protein